MKMLGVARANGLAEIVSMQDFYNLVYREEEREMLPLCQAEGIAVIPVVADRPAAISPARAWAATPTLPATMPRPCGPATDPFAVELKLGSPQDEAIRQRVADAAKQLGSKPAVVALAWVLSKPAVTAPIIGASKPHHLEDAVAAVSLKLDPEIIAMLEEPTSRSRWRATAERPAAAIRRRHAGSPGRRTATGAAAVFAPRHCPAVSREGRCFRVGARIAARRNAYHPLGLRRARVATSTPSHCPAAHDLWRPHLRGRNSRAACVQSNRRRGGCGERTARINARSRKPTCILWSVEIRPSRWIAGR